MKRKFNERRVVAAVELLLDGLGVDLSDANFDRTPQRVARAYWELCRGNSLSASDRRSLFDSKFPSAYDGLLHLGPFHGSSLCPHHLMPVNYLVVFAYVPAEYKLGLSKFVRAFRAYAARPVLQETLSYEFIEDFVRYVRPRGAALFLQGTHSCITGRGVREAECQAITQDVRGVLRTDLGIKGEFEGKLQLLLRGQHA